MQKKKSIWQILLDFVEIFLPAFTFAAMFCCFLVQILFRYVFRNPQNWTNEMISICFVWTIMLGSCIALRENDHVVFSLVYDERGPKGKLVMDILSNGICAVLFGMLLYPTLQFLVLQYGRFTPVLHIRYAFVYAPFGIMLLITVVRQVYRVILSIRRLFGIKNAVQATADTENKEEGEKS